MSRVGKKSIPLPKGVTLSVESGVVNVKGPKGAISRPLPGCLSVNQSGAEVIVERADESKTTRALHGTVRSHINNMIAGVLTGYTRELEIHGVGFKAAVKGKELVLNLGYSHEIRFTPPEGVTIVVTDNTQVAVSGVDVEKVGDSAARIRSYYKAEPYKGKGVRYKGEKIRRKTGKAVS